jgi:hypothetical protein
MDDGIKVFFPAVDKEIDSVRKPGTNLTFFSYSAPVSQVDVVDA